ncbi:MAG: four-carbon acid sugar kinase family protein [Verrucomicrobia bacterium]|nr:four-carbon acid sugar kinase family protein [Verrucomicrobiota bacterium]
MHSSLKHRRPRPSKQRLLLAFYGDDFTGSTDAMESLARAGLRTVLFLQPPALARLRQYPGLRAFGVAGTSRTMSPPEMARELPAIFGALRASRTPLVHYKVCSTFDSSPSVGSIGKAIDLARSVFGSPAVPLLVGAPMLGRYCVFGNLFARSGLDSEPYRLDRHPTMRRHPATPMTEADLRLHLARQTRKTIGLLDIVQLDSPHPEARWDALRAQGAEVILLDVCSEEQLPKLGQLLWRHARPAHPLFAVGSSCVEYALASWWRRAGLLRSRPPLLRLDPAPALAVVSGSCSPVTDRQNRLAASSGFAEIALDTVRLVHPKTRLAELARALEASRPFFAAQRSVIFHTARGPDDPRIARTARALRGRGLGSAAVLGSALGELLEAVLEQTGLRRGVVTGGDISSFAARALGVEALEFAAPIAPGAPLCRVHAPSRVADGREIVFKGGQNGRNDFLLTVLQGISTMSDKQPKASFRRQSKRR